MRDSALPISNFRLASFILSRGHDVVGTTREGRRVYFLFADTDDLRHSVNLFRFHNPSVRIHDLLSAQSRLKSLIFDGDNYRGSPC